MHGLGIGDFGRRDNGRHVQVAFAGLRGANTDAFIREGGVEGILVRRGIHGNRGDAHLTAGPDDPYGYFAAIGYENTSEHGHR